MRLFVLLLLLPCACRDFDARASQPARHTAMLRDGFHRGVNYAHVHRKGHGYGSEASARELDSLAALGVSHIAITPFGYQDGATADRIAGWDSATDRFTPRDGSMLDHNLHNEIAAAHARRIAVVLKPQVWSHDFLDGREWHGSVRQSDPEGATVWWKSYSAFIMHYARLAADDRVEVFCIGTELVGLSTSHPERWRALIGDIRRFYRGSISYAAHWDRELTAITFWPDLDFIGINAYFPLDADDTSSVSAVAAAWRPHLDRISRIHSANGRPVLFLEAGYRPATGAFREPWRHQGGDGDLSIQSRAYEAMFIALRDSAWWQGLYLWKAFTDPDRASSYGEDQGFAFRRRPAEAVVRRWYAR